MNISNKPFPRQREIDLPCPHAMRARRLHRDVGLPRAVADAVAEIHFGLDREGGAQ